MIIYKESERKMITQQQLEVSAKAYAILAAGKKYEVLLRGDTEWKGPFGVEDISDTSVFGVAAIDVRAAKEPQVRYVVLNENDTHEDTFGGTAVGEANATRLAISEPGWRVIRMVEDLTYKG